MQALCRYVLQCEFVMYHTGKSATFSVAIHPELVALDAEL